MFNFSFDNKPKRCFSVLASLLVSILSFASFAQAETRVFEWTAPTTNADGTPLTDLGGYEIGWGTTSSSYTNKLTVGTATRASVPGLQTGTRYYFAVRAFDTTGNFSTYSNQVTFIAALDSDGDGLSDSAEEELGTSASNPDTDGDGVKDGQEVVDGTSPLDKGSALPVLGARICGEWNGFLSGMANVFEHVNLSDNALGVVTTIYNSLGVAQSAFGFSIPAGSQFDALVHDMAGRALNAYGLVCSQHNGSAGDLGGRMVYYKGNQPGARKVGDFQFAFAMEMSAGKKGSQFVPFNTFQPSLRLADRANPVANWIQLTNLGDTTESGALIFYDQAGIVLASTEVTLAAGGRADYSGHRFGANLVGVVEWRPSSSAVSFLLRNVRYVSDNAVGVENYDTAFQLEGMQGTGEQLLVPFDTVGRSAILELMNTLNQPVEVDVTVSGGSGASFTLTLPAYGSFHYIADSILGPNASGYAVIKGRTRNSIAAVAMQYTYRGDMSVSNMYGLPAKEALGTVLRGSYNTFLNQVSWLVIVSQAAQDVSISTVNGAGQAGGSQTVNVSGVRVVNLNDLVNTNEYGVANVQPQIPNSIVAWVLRARGSEYVIPTVVR